MKSNYFMNKEKITSVERVKEFMITAGQPVYFLTSHVDIDKFVEERLYLRLSLCLEELSELACEGFGKQGAVKFQKLLQEKSKEIFDALYNEEIPEKCDRKAALDGLADMRVVADGFAWEIGLGESLEAAVNEVMDSNMSKFCILEEDIKATVIKYANLGIETTTEKVGDFYVIYRKEDNKVLKGINYREPDLGELLQ